MSTPTAPRLLLPEITEQEITHEVLLDFELFWASHYDWLRERGYLLRPRYRPGWVASWVGTKKWRKDCEDYQVQELLRSNLDAIRVSDGKSVMLRRADPPSLSDELQIGRLLSSTSSDRRNHCVPIHENITLPEPDLRGRDTISVMPFLVDWDEPEFGTVGEVVDFCSQVFEGLQYMHNLNVAHNDAKFDNIMMDWFPLYADPPHPAYRFFKLDWSGPSKPRNRTLYPVKYFFIDWDLSKQHDLSSGTPVRVQPGYGVDVYCLGNVIRKKFILGDPRYCLPRRNVEFLEGLISDMTQDDPAKRPTMDQVVIRFAEIRKGLSWWKLRSRVPETTAPLLPYWLYSPIHWAVQLSYIIRRIPAIPDYTRNQNGHSEV
ncbi:hypothetical protein D9757_013495 [Collybiopsis confluens]|uniref:Protein kinase domain-containing protein n=1 Tax=Collybiopsis confluens TaxID=2823264 RepID=A0A8H5FT13_9AGAR|nr:hypothetical protein D9757_013495 [Collybiopsis confluens]